MINVYIIIGFIFLLVVMIIVAYMLYTKLVVSDLTRSQRAFTSLNKANSSMILAGKSRPFNSKLHSEASKEATQALADWAKYFPKALVKDPVKAKALLLKWAVLAATVSASIIATVPKSVAATVGSHTVVTTAAVTAAVASHTAVTTATTTPTSAATAAVTAAAVASTAASHTSVTTAAIDSANVATTVSDSTVASVVAPVVAAVSAVTAPVVVAPVVVAPVVVAPVGPATYVGCYGDANDPGVGFCAIPRPGRICDGRAISGIATQPVPLYEGCIEQARRLGHTMMGLQAGNQCFTGNDLTMATTKYGKVAFDGSPTVCTNVAGNIVGGGYTNAIYTIN
jgi:hypothetical protein